MTDAATTGVDFHLSFGSAEASNADGCEQGKAAQDFFTSLHTVPPAPDEGA